MAGPAGKLEDIYIRLPLTTVYGKLAGTPSDPLVLGIHGWSQRNGWHTWEPLMAPLALAGFCVVSVDMPGWGDSPAMDSLPLMGERAVQVVIGILNKLQKESSVLMGKSWGGAVAVQTAQAYPKRISQLILTAPALRDPQIVKTLSQPILLAWSEDDPVIPDSQAEAIRGAGRDVTLVTYATGGHSAAMKNAADFGPRAIKFLSGQ